MDGSRRRMLLVVSVAALTAIGAGLLIGLSEDNPEPRFEIEATDRPIEGTGGMTPAPRAAHGDSTVAEPLIQSGPSAEEEKAEQGLDEGPSGPPPASADELASAAVVKRYLAAIDGRDGDAVCASFERGALAEVEFPSPHVRCPAKVEASLGDHEPGLPVWRGSRPTGAISSQVEDESATVTVTVTTTYAGDREPSIEDDVVYLRRRGKVWRIVKPSATLYRAIGVADVPIAAISPPG